MMSRNRPKRNKRPSVKLIIPSSTSNVSPPPPKKSKQPRQQQAINPEPFTPTNLATPSLADMHCDPNESDKIETEQMPTSPKTRKNASLAIKTLCKKYNRTVDESRCMVNAKRRVVYVLSTGRINSSSCFVNDTITITSGDSPLPSSVNFKSSKPSSISTSTSKLPIKHTFSSPKRMHHETLNDSVKLSAPSTPTQTYSSSHKRTTKYRSKATPRKTREVLTLVPDGFTVAFCAFQHAWIGVVAYKKISYIGNSDEHVDKMFGLHKVTPVSAFGRIDSQHESDFCDTPTRAFRQAYDKKFDTGTLVEGRRPNGRLFFGFHCIKMQLKLHQAFEHQYIGTVRTGETSRGILDTKERTFFDRWSGELALRSDMLPWTLHEPLVRNASLDVPVSLESLIRAELVLAGLQDLKLRTIVDDNDFITWKASDVIMAITTCSCCSPAAMPRGKYRLRLGMRGEHTVSKPTVQRRTAWVQPLLLPLSPPSCVVAAPVSAAASVTADATALAAGVTATAGVVGGGGGEYSLLGVDIDPICVPLVGLGSIPATDLTLSPDFFQGVIGCGEEQTSAYLLFNDIVMDDSFTLKQQQQEERQQQSAGQQTFSDITVQDFFELDQDQTEQQQPQQQQLQQKYESQPFSVKFNNSFKLEETQQQQPQQQQPQLQYEQFQQQQHRFQQQQRQQQGHQQHLQLMLQCEQERQSQHDYKPPQQHLHQHLQQHLPAHQDLMLKFQQQDMIFQLKQQQQPQRLPHSLTAHPKVFFDHTESSAAAIAAAAAVAAVATGTALTSENELKLVATKVKKEEEEGEGNVMEFEQLMDFAENEFDVYGAAGEPTDFNMDGRYSLI